MILILKVKYSTSQQNQQNRTDARGALTTNEPIDRIIRMPIDRRINGDQRIVKML